MVKHTSLSLTTEAQVSQILKSSTDKQSLSVLATIQACTSPEDEQIRAPIDVVLVLDVSGSMSGRKLSLVQKTCHFLIRELGKRDRLGIVAFHSHVRTELTLRCMDSDGKEAAKQAVDSLRTLGSTNLSGGVMEGIALVKEEPTTVSTLKSRVSSSVSSVWQSITSSTSTAAATKPTDDKRVKSVLLLTDGAMNQGVTDPVKLESMVRQALGERVSLHTFGYGADSCVDVLQSLAKVGGGSSYFIQDSQGDDEVAKAFGDCLGGLLSVVAQNLVVVVEASSGVELTGFSRAGEDDVEFDSRRIVMSLRDIYAEEQRNLIFEVSVSGGGSSDRLDLARVFVTFVDVLNSDPQARVEATASVERVAEITAVPSINVAKQIARVRATKAMKTAVEMADSNDIEGCRALLAEQIASIQSDERFSNDRVMEELSDDVSKLLKSVKSREDYDRGGRHLMKASAGHYGAERSALASSSNAYQNASKTRMWKASMMS